MELHPQFDFSTSTILRNDKKLTEKGNELTNRFPIEVFPERIQQIIYATSKSLKYPVDFTGSSMLFTVSVAIGNTHRAEVMPGWTESAVIYLALVGHRGINKSHPLKWALAPIAKRDDFNHKKYLEEKKKYDTIVNALKKGKGQQGYTEPIKPYWEQYLLGDFTPEALTEVHKLNKRGIGVSMDELMSLINNFNRYNKGSEEEFWLSAWSGQRALVNRKGSEPTLIQLPFISVVGSIQPGKLKKLAENRIENGFSDRILFTMPDNLKKEYWSTIKLNPEIEEDWQAIISKLLDLPLKYDDNFNPKPELLKCTTEADALIRKWQHDNTDQFNDTEDEVEKGICAKIEMYAIRLALILEMMRYACDESKKEAIEIESVKGAIKLVEYFKRSALKVHAEVLSPTNPLSELPEYKRNFYHALPDTFTSAEGLKIAEGLKFPESSCYKFWNDKELFEKQSQSQRIIVIKRLQT